MFPSACNPSTPTTEQSTIPIASPTSSPSLSPQPSVTATPVPSQVPTTKPTSPPSGVHPDDIIVMPGFGPAYSATFHPDWWPPVKETVAEINAFGSGFKIRYRSYIETSAGEDRNNLIIFYSNARNLLDLNKVIYRVHNLPPGIAVVNVGTTFGRVSPGVTETSGVHLIIHTSQDMEPGEYHFDIGLEYDSKEFGVLPCTIRIIE